MITVKVSTCSPYWPWLRQTPGGKGVWGNCRFLVDQDVDECDYWVVIEGLTKPETTRCPQGNTILITQEPPAIKTYKPDFINQFGTVLTCHRDVDHPNVVYSQQGLPWMVGGKFNIADRTWGELFTKNYDELVGLKGVQKDKLISVIYSKKDKTSGHLKRNELIQFLKSFFGSDLDVFGVGINEIQDKWDAISHYKYHIVIENSRYQDYWTEKLSDAFLSFSYPFYFGCPNIEKYFSQPSMTIIDIMDKERVLETISNKLINDSYTTDLEYIVESRNLVLNEYNIFNIIEKLCNKSDDKKRSNLELIPESISEYQNRTDKYKFIVKRFFNVK